MCYRPVGFNRFVASGITRMRIAELHVAVLPWLLNLNVFVILTATAPISLWLPRGLAL